MSGPFACRVCGVAGAIVMPSDIAIRQVRCSACGREQFANAYASGAQQLFEEMARIQVAKADRSQKLAQGVLCNGCGATTPLPSDPMIDAFACPFCGRQHMMTEFLDPKLVANQRLRADLGARIEAARTAGASRDRVIVIVLVAALLAVAIVVAAVKMSGQ
jgi:hypothetical protein